MTDDLLEQHFSQLSHPMDDSDWLAVQRRARRPRRRVALVAVVAAATALLVAPAFGIGGRVMDLIQGDPAPPEVQSYFAASNEHRERLFAFAAAAGHELGDRFPLVVPGEARGVAAIETADGPIYLWAAPTEDGRQCWLVHASAANGPAGGLGSCDGIDRTGSIRPDGPFWTDQRPNVRIMHVRIYDDVITRVDIQFEDAPEISLPVVSGHALGTIPNAPARLHSVVGRDADGVLIERWTAPQ